MAGLRVARMNDHAPVEREAIALRQFPLALFLILVERLASERIEREQAVIPRVPVSGMARIFRTIEDRDAQLLAI